ncbi:MAG: SDR family NAD(P)-dependent oxidoreductase [Bacteroidota bacterium]
MDLGLNDHVAIVTGASRGIGNYIAHGLAAEGCHLAICARSADAIEAAAADLRKKGVEVLALALDLTEPDAGQQLVDAAMEKFGRVDVLVNNVGGNRRKPFAETTDQDWDEMLDLNVHSHFRTTRAAIPHMQAAGSGSIVFISSIFGREAGGPGLSIYNTTKTALISAAKIMALELAPDGIRVNSVAPGSIRFPGGSWDRRVHEQPEKMKAFIAQNLPLGRFGKATEVADVVTFLASERASLITGACLTVDGSQSSSLI